MSHNLPHDAEPKLDYLAKHPKGKILRNLSFNDFTFWGTDSLVSVIYTLFVIDHIDGGSATIAGISFMISRFAGLLFTIPIGNLFDRIKGQADEIDGLIISNLLCGIAYIGLSYANAIWHLYLAMFIIGVARSIDVTAWRILFYSNIKKNKYGETLGIYQTLMSLTMGMAVAMGGLIGDAFGYQIVMLTGGIMLLAGGLLPLMIRDLVEGSEKKTWRLLRFKQKVAD